MARRFVVWGLAGGLIACLSGALGCARPVRVARPGDEVDYVILRAPGMVPQARIERCTDEGCEQVYEAKRRPAGEAP